MSTTYALISWGVLVSVGDSLQSYLLRHSWRIWYGESSPALLVSSYTLESSILIWLKYCGGQRTVSKHVEEESAIRGDLLGLLLSSFKAEVKSGIPPVRRLRRASPLMSASQSQGWGFPVWLELEFRAKKKKVNMRAVGVAPHTH